MQPRRFEHRLIDARIGHESEWCHEHVASDQHQSSSGRAAADGRATSAVRPFGRWLLLLLLLLLLPQLITISALAASLAS